MQQRKNIKAVAKLCGVRCHWWQSKRAVTRNIVKKMRGIDANARAGAQCFYPPRHLVREEVIEFDQAPYCIDNGVAIETPGPLQRVKVWRFHYSDGDVEQVTSRRGAHATA